MDGGRQNILFAAIQKEGNKMKKSLILLVVGLLMLNFSTLSFAERFNKSGGIVSRIIEGQIVSIDKAKNQFVVKDDDDGREVTIQAWASDIAKLSQSAHVKITLPQFSNLATTVR